MPRPIREVPWLEQRDNGWFYVHWYDADKRQTFRESLKTRDPAEAARRFGEFLVAGPGRRTRGPDGLTVSAALDLYWRQHVTATDDKGRPLVVALSRQQVSVDHLKTYFGDRPLKSIGPMECRGYLAARRKAEVSGRRNMPAKDSTVRRELAVLGAAARHAVKWGSLQPNDMPRIELPKVTESAKVKWFTKDQLRTILREAVTEADYNTLAFTKIAYYTAARRRSIEDLTKFQVDLAAGTITLQPPGGLVTKKRRPVVPIHPEIRPVVETLMQTPGEYLFGNDPSRDFYYRFVELCAACGFPDSHPHMLRHSRASHLLQDGVPIWTVARLLGDTVATVERTYAHCLADDLKTESNLGVAR